MKDRIENLVAVHCILAKICGNTFYDIMVNALIAITQEIIVNTFEQGRDEPIHGYGKHDGIVKAVLAGDSKKASESMFEHLQGFAKAFGNYDNIRKGKPPLI
jgi:DNA-binding FadR family transcriptional regulator